MIKIYIFTDSYKHFESAIWEYQKRLGKNIEIYKLKPIKYGSAKEIIRDETQILREKLKKVSWYRVILTPKWHQMTTEKFVQLIEQSKNRTQDIIFCIWGAYGLDYELLKDSVDGELSFSQMILPHALALIVLLEQVYRASEIVKGSEYHK